LRVAAGPLVAYARSPSSARGRITRNTINARTLGAAIPQNSVIPLIFTPAFYVICRWIALKTARRQPPATPERQPAE